MSQIVIFSVNAPKIGALEFDAVLETSLEAETQVTSYALESGARASDHAVLLPIKATMTIAVSSSALKTLATDLSVGALSTGSSSLTSALAGYSAAALAGSEQTRPSSALEALLELRAKREPLDLYCGDIILNNMIITKVSRTLDVENENVLLAQIELQELATIDTMLSQSSPRQNALQGDDKSKLAAVVSLGEKTMKAAGDAVNKRVSNLLGAVL